MISTKGRYALRMMIDLAEHYNENYVSLKDISERQEISKKYLEQIIPLLARANMLAVTRGPHGGYRLSKGPDEYTVGDILRAAEGSLAPVSCLESESNFCPRSSYCKTLPIWIGLNRVVNEYVDGISLQDILEMHAGNDYVI